MKLLYKIYHHYAYKVSKKITKPGLRADYVVDANGHVLPYVFFSGGQMALHAEALQVLETAKRSHQ